MLTYYFMPYTRELILQKMLLMYGLRVDRRKESSPKKTQIFTQLIIDWRKLSILSKKFSGYEFDDYESNSVSALW